MVVVYLCMFFSIPDIGFDLTSLAMALQSYRIRWLYYVPFMTYGFRSLMQIEYGGDDLHIQENVNNTDYNIEMEGDDLLKFFEIDTEPIQDIGILIAWVCLMHLVSIAYLLWYKYKSKRTFVYSDK